MAVLAVVSEGEDDMEILYLNEDIWLDSNCCTFHMLNPLVFRVKKPLKGFSIIFHGKPIDPEEFSLFKENLTVDKNVVIASDLFEDKSYCENLGWEEGIKRNNKGNLDIEFVKDVKELDAKDIKIEWKGEDLKECSILRVMPKNTLNEGNYYLVIGTYLAPPKPHWNIIKKACLVGKSLRSTTQYFIHYYTFRNVDKNDRRKIRQLGYHKRFVPVCTKMAKNGSSNFTSTLFVYTYQGKAIGIIPIHYEIAGWNRPPAKEPFDKNQRPFSTDELLPPWRGYKWDNSTDSLCYTPEKVDRHKNIEGEKDIEIVEEYILPSFDLDEKEEKERIPLKIDVEKYSPQRMALRFALFFSIFSFLRCGEYIQENSTAGILAVICAISLVELFSTKQKQK